MGHGLSCGRDGGEEHALFRAVQLGDLDALLAADPELARRATTRYDRLSLLHVAAANGQLQVLSMLLDDDDDAGAPARPDVDVLNRKKQTPLMLAAMHGRTDCVLRLLDAGANILMFDSVNARTCLHHAAYYGHADCLQAILAAAKTSPVADSWGFARFVNVRDEHGATPLHLAARQGRPQCVHHLLHAGAIVSAPTASYGFPGSTALHLAARRGHLDCVRELLAWGADRLHRDSAGRIAYAVALRRGHRACAALVNPAAAEPMVWPSPLKFISELNPEAKALLEAALMEANREREKQLIVNLKRSTTAKTDSSSYSSSSADDDGTIATAASSSSSSSLDDDDDDAATELCGICLEQACSMEVQDCGHQMCAACTLALCCHSKPNPTTLALQPPACPFCRATITRLLVANKKTSNSGDEAALGGVRSHGSSSFRGLTSAIRSLSLPRIGRGSGRVADSDGICHGQGQPSTPCGVNSLLPAQAIIPSLSFFEDPGSK